MTNINVILRLPKFLESSGPGVLEQWSVGALIKSTSFL
jgi:hypothetical protein